MGGFSQITGDPIGSVINANNVSFDGTERGGVITTDGQLLIGSTALPHIKVGTLSSSDGSLSFTPGSGTINIRVSGGTTVGRTITGDTGGPLSPSSGNWNLLGSSSVTTSGSGSTLNFNVANWVAPTSFTPGFAFGGGVTGITYSVQVGQYTRIGKTVFFAIQIALTSKGSSTGVATVTGLPITTANVMPNNTPAMFYQTVTYTGNPACYIDTNATTIELGAIASAGTFTALTNAAFTNTSQISISGFYFTA